MTTTDSFVRRVNPDTTIDSICLSCFRTVATGKSEFDLLSAEKKHSCDSFMEQQWWHIESQMGAF
jgi:hypothetical protein